MSELRELVAILENRSEMYYRRRDALVKLMKLDPARGTEAAVALSGDPEKVIRREAARLLGQGPAEIARPTLVAMLADEDSDVRKNALSSLASAGDASCIPAIRPLLDDPSFFVKKEAEKAIDKIEKAARPVAAAKPTPSQLRHDAVRAEPPAEAPAPAPAPALEGRLPPWKAHGAASPAAETPPNETPADMVLRLRQKRDRLKAAKAARAGTQMQTPQTQRRPAPGSGADKRSYKVYIPVTAPSGERIDASAPTLLKPPPPIPTREESSAAQRLCPKCRWVLRADQRYCNFCGFALSPSGGGEPAPQPKPMYSPKYAQRPVTTFTRSSATRTGMGCAGAAAIIVVIGIVATAATWSKASRSQSHRSLAAAAFEEEARMLQAETEARKKAAARAAVPDDRVPADAIDEPLIPADGNPGGGRESDRVMIRMTWNEVFVGNITKQDAEYVWIDVGGGKVYQLGKSQMKEYKKLK